MSNFITKTFDWGAAMQKVSDQIEEGNSVVQKRIEQHIGMLIFRQHRYGRDYDGVNALATTFFDMNGFTFSYFSKNEELSDDLNLDTISQEKYMLRLMEMRYAMKVVYSGPTATEAFHYWTVGDHDT